jgi:cysteine desulfurase
MNVYLDNAATTPLDPRVLEAMMPYFSEHFGNPSSTHAHGRATRSAIEAARKEVAELLGVTPGELFFTSGGTEADNTALRCSIEALNLKHAITSRTEHHAVLHPLQTMEQNGQIQLSYVRVDAQGNVDFNHLEELLANNPRSLVSLMHGNNEIGNLTDLGRVGELCAAHDAVFHSDTVQTLAHYPLNLRELPVHCVAGAAHKFHGPKGVGLLYINKAHKIHPLLRGGNQERSMRGGTENLYGIIGLARALAIACEEMMEHQRHIRALKQRMIGQLQARIPDVRFNGTSGQLDDSLYTVLNVSFPPSDASEMLLFNLDLSGISVSGGSACSSGAALGSHVLRALDADAQRAAVRFSFSRLNTVEEVDYVVNKVAKLYPAKAASSVSEPY